MSFLILSTTARSGSLSRRYFETLIELVPSVMQKLSTAACRLASSRLSVAKTLPLTVTLPLSSVSVSMLTGFERMALPMRTVCFFSPPPFPGAGAAADGCG